MPAATPLAPMLWLTGHIDGQSPRLVRGARRNPPFTVVKASSFRVARNGMKLQFSRSHASYGELRVGGLEVVFSQPPPRI